MEESGMTKQQTFLYIVQTAVLANGINLASSQSEERKNEYRDVFSASGILGLMHDILWASERIPREMTAIEAADDFCTYMLRNLRKLEEADGPSLNVPAWFARH